MAGHSVDTYLFCGTVYSGRSFSFHFFVEPYIVAGHSVDLCFVELYISSRLVSSHLPVEPYKMAGHSVEICCVEPYIVAVHY